MGPEDGRAKNPYDEKRAESAIRELLIALGEDPDREGLKDTPARVARAYAENMAGLYQSPRDSVSGDLKPVDGKYVVYQTDSGSGAKPPVAITVGRVLYSRSNSEAIRVTKPST